VYSDITNWKQTAVGKRIPEFLDNLYRQGGKLMTNLQGKSREFILVNQFYRQLYFEGSKIQKLFEVSIEEEIRIIITI
jgi:hypothetical protein